MLSYVSSTFEDLAGRIILITGGSNGLGLAAAALFSSHGAFLAIADLCPPSEPVPDLIFAFCDVASWESIL